MPTSPNMNLNLPAPSSTIGPDWAADLNTALDTVDSHDHTAGKGVQIPSAGINIDDTLMANGETITELRSTQYENLTANLTGAPESNSVHVKDGDLWFTNSSGTAVQVTSGGSVNTPSSSNTPAGIVLPYAGTSAPSGYLLCDGSAVSRSTYATLFGVVGTTYGVGDGSTTFNLPNMQGRVPMGVGTYTDSVSGSTTRTLAQTVGAAAHQLSISEMPSHNHGGGAHTHFTTIDGSTGSTLTAANSVSRNGAAGGGDTDYILGSNGTANATIGLTSGPNTTVVQSQGSGSTHNNMQPSLGLNYIIKT